MAGEPRSYSPEVQRAGTGSADTSADSITCPNCGKKIPLTQALRAEFEEQTRIRLEAEQHQRELELRAEAKRDIQAAVIDAEARAKESLAVHTADLEAQVREKTASIDTANTVELELRARQRELEDKGKSFAVELARQVDVERKAAEQQTTERLGEEFKLREAQSKEQLASLSRTIEDLKRKVEQGSQQTQGEAAEVELEALLRQGFPIDDIAPVGKGVRGADIVHTVRTPTGTDCAIIVWETKNAKAWSPKWLEKIRDDQRDTNAALAVIVTNVLPAGLRGFGNAEGVWVCDLVNAPMLAAVLRAQLHAVQRERASAEGRTTKESLLYDYMTGNEFQQRVVAVVTAMSRMKQGLDKERNIALKTFAKRDKQITGAATHIAELYGAAQGIIGGALPTVALLETSDDDDSSDVDEGATGLLSS